MTDWNPFLGKKPEELVRYDTECTERMSVIIGRSGRMATELVSRILADAAIEALIERLDTIWNEAHTEGYNQASEDFGASDEKMQALVIANLQTQLKEARDKSVKEKAYTMLKDQRIDTLLDENNFLKDIAKMKIAATGSEKLKECGTCNYKEYCSRMITHNIPLNYDKSLKSIFYCSEWEERKKANSE